MVILIKLLGGPRDGEELEISMDMWRKGIIVMPDLPKPFKFTLASEVIQDTSYRTLHYVKQRWWQGWGCIAKDYRYADEARLFHAAEPEFKWCYLGNNWTKL